MTQTLGCCSEDKASAHGLNTLLTELLGRPLSLVYLDAAVVAGRAD